jgi:hypothetical protein
VRLGSSHPRFVWAYASRFSLLLILLVAAPARARSHAGESADAAAVPGVPAAAAARPRLVAAATDPAAGTVAGPSRVAQHPRTVAEQVLVLGGGARLTARTAARAISVRLPTVFQSPGPGYGRFLTSRLRWRVDAGPWRDLWPAALAPEVVLDADLAPLPGGAPHVLDVEAVGGEAGVVGFRFADGPIGAIVGMIHSDDLGELLTDVRAEVFPADGGADDAGPVVTEYTRSPVNGRFSVLGLPPGAYRLRLTASGWPAAEVVRVEVPRPGEVVDVGLVTLGERPDSDGWGWDGPRLGRTACVQPGGTFALLQHTPSPSRLAARVELVSAFRTVALEPAAAPAAEAVRAAPWPMERVTYRVPDGTPLDMYALRMTYPPAPAAAGPPPPPVVRAWPGAVSVCEPLPASYHLAGVGHMNTAVQETAEYLERVAATAELAGARVLMVANEVNAAYVAGALRPLRVPVLVTAGNHTMGRWDALFADRPEAFDDGPLRVVTFHDFPTQPWDAAGALLGARLDASARVLLCYEGYAPLDLIRGRGVSLIFDGHSDVPHPERAAFPPGTMHMRAPGQDTIRWIPMTHRGVDPSAAGAEPAVPVIAVPRTGPSPLRAAFSAPCDGTADRLTVRVVNETDVTFPAARVRLVLRGDGGGDYRIEGADVVQSFASDDGRARVIDVKFAAPARAQVTIRADPGTPP